ncbi:STAGA complex 65 subunit gamma [Acropora cervicornis]|uniref:STAGA complex 65 subunit gamma n=1 Tax=Acropora cervicornis TaxID=6130 RepID=A0AAD9R3K2_ACRCE|nr:STAGA complex 65 subunit gamma [Acropora cervicornis]
MLSSAFLGEEERCVTSARAAARGTRSTGNMATTDSVEQGNVQRHWGELQQLLPKTIPLHIDMAEPKAAEYEVPRLHQPSCEHFPPKDELPAKFMASVKPPLDKHSQNLTLHCIELQHHKRRMRLMLMAAQHQYGEGGKSESSDASSLPAHPPRSKRFCSSQGIITPPTQSTILSRAQETPSTLEQNSTLTCAELDSVSNRHLLMQSVATLLASESALEILTDILDDFNTKFCRLLRIRVDNQAMHGRTGFPVGVFGVLFFCFGIQDYVLRLDQEDLEMINEYKSFFVSKPDSLCKTQESSDKSLFREHPRRTFWPRIHTDTSDQTSDFAHLSPYAVVPNGSMTGGGNSDPTSPNWGMTYIKTEGEEEETFDDPITGVPKTPQS